MKTNKISVAPVKKYAPPKYPTLMVATREPALLRKLPSRWQKNAAVVAAVGMLGAMTTLNSCGVHNSNSALSPIQETAAAESTDFLDTVEQIIGYDHGYTVPQETTEPEYCETIYNPMLPMGLPAPSSVTSEQDVMATLPETDTQETSSSECAGGSDIICETIETLPVSMSSFVPEQYPLKILAGTSGPPVFLSEEGAIAIITGMAESVGLNLQNESSQYSDTKDEEITLYDAEKHVAVTYKYGGWEEDTYVTSDGVATGVFYYPEYWDDKEYLQLLNEYETKIDEIYQTCYDETGKNNEEYLAKLEEVDENMKSLMEENLRAQVRDFIDWLQGQGII